MERVSGSAAEDLYRYVCTVWMDDYHVRQNMDQPDKVANPARGQLNKGN